MNKPHDLVLDALSKLQSTLNKLGIKINLIDARMNQQQSTTGVIDYDIHAVHEEGHTHSKKSEASPMVRAKLHLPEAIRVKDESKGSKNPVYEWLMFGVQAIGMSAAIIAAFIYGSQLSKMREANGISQQQFDLTRKSTERETKALVNIKASGDLQAVPNSELRLPIRLTNLGKTTADHVIVNLFVDIVPRLTPPPLFSDGPRPAIHYVAPDLLPTDVHDLWAYRMKVRGEVREGGDEERSPLTEAEYKSLHSGDTYVVVHGRVTYDDVYGVSHWSQLCTWTHYTALGYNAESCAKYNTVDKNDEP